MSGTRTSMRLVVVLAAFAMATPVSLPAESGRETAPPDIRTDWSDQPTLSGPSFRAALEAPVPGVSWRRVPLRDVLRQLTEAYRIAVLRDRRIDPTVLLDVQSANVPLKDVLKEIAREAGGAICIVENTVLLGPPDSIAIVRTLTEIRKQELLSLEGRGIAGRLLALQRGRTVVWGDLTEPRDIVRQIAEKYEFTVENLERIPHDLWAGSRLQGMAAHQMLTCVLIQFDLTFAWSEDLRSIQLLPLPTDRSTIAVERTYRLRGSAEDAVEAWQEQFGPLVAHARGQRVVVRGLVEQHERIEQARAGGTDRTADEKKPAAGVVPLSRRQFTLTVARAPVVAIMEKLEQTGVTFEYDAAVLEAAGVNLETPVDLDVKQVDAEVFFESLFRPMGVATDISGTTVRLRPLD